MGRTGASPRPPARCRRPLSAHASARPRTGGSRARRLPSPSTASTRTGWTLAGSRRCRSTHRTTSSATTSSSQSVPAPGSSGCGTRSLASSSRHTVMRLNVSPASLRCPRSSMPLPWCASGGPKCSAGQRRVAGTMRADHVGPDTAATPTCETCETRQVVPVDPTHIDASAASSASPSCRFRTAALITHCAGPPTRPQPVVPQPRATIVVCLQLQRR